jgi:hypothetical protein
MKITKRFYTDIIQQRELAVKTNGVGKEWIPRIETKYEFLEVDEFLRTFKPVIFSDALRSAIEKAYNECGNVTFNAGNGNQKFYFTS